MLVGKDGALGVCLEVPPHAVKLHDGVYTSAAESFMMYMY